MELFARPDPRVQRLSRLTSPPPVTVLSRAPRAGKDLLLGPSREIAVMDVCTEFVGTPCIRPGRSIGWESKKSSQIPSNWTLLLQTDAMEHE